MFLGFATFSPCFLTKQIIPHLLTGPERLKVQIKSVLGGGEVGVCSVAKNQRSEINWVWGG